LCMPLLIPAPCPYTTLFRSCVPGQLKHLVDIEQGPKRFYHAEKDERKHSEENKRKHRSSRNEKSKPADGLIDVQCDSNDGHDQEDRKSTRLNSSHQIISYAV